MKQQQQFVAHLLEPSGDGYAPVAWSPAAAAVAVTDDRDVIRADYEADVDLLDAVLPLSALTDRVATGWLLAFVPQGAAVAAIDGPATIDELTHLEVRSVVRRRADIARGTVTLTTRLLQP